MSAMKPPATGIKVRMYRQGHGDCFLLATKKKNSKPFYMLIDCGLWRNSEIDKNVTIDKIVDSIRDATSGQLDVVLITHEHEDHVNGFGATRADGSDSWSNFTIGEVWLSWTEDGTDDDANALRKRFDDVLLGLAGAMTGPHAMNVANDDRLQMIHDVLALHTGTPDVRGLATSLVAHREISMDSGGLLAAKVPGIKNKEAMQKMRHAAGTRVRFLDPQKGPYAHDAVAGMRVFALGPPRDAKLLLSLDPKGAEEFKFQVERSSLGLMQALSTDPDEVRAGRPFSPRHGTPIDRLTDQQSASADFFRIHHGFKDQAVGGAEWRRIDDDWLDSAEALAMRLNDEVNNTSLVIAIELAETGKVLLFSGDAQRGSWISWSGLKWELAADKTVSARELLGRTVFYKVGHHGSHNATLNGLAGDPHANLSWFGLGEHAEEFVAMIPANKEWAFDRKPHPWKHPLKAIEDALMEKARGRVFRTDEAGGPKRPNDVPVAEWKRFTSNSTSDELYFEYVVTDS